MSTTCLFLPAISFGKRCLTLCLSPGSICLIHSTLQRVKPVITSSMDHSGIDTDIGISISAVASLCHVRGITNESDSRIRSILFRKTLFVFLSCFTISLIHMPKSRQSKKGILEASSIEAIADHIKNNDGNSRVMCLRTTELTLFTCSEEYHRHVRSRHLYCCWHSRFS